MNGSVYLPDPSAAEVFRALLGLVEDDAKVRIAATQERGGVVLSWSFVCCLACGGNLTGRAERYCSGRCTAAGNRKTAQRKRYERERYLRLKAGGELARVRPVALIYDRKCAHCPTIFTTTRATQKHCGLACKRRAFHAAHPGKRAEYDRRHRLRRAA